MMIILKILLVVQVIFLCIQIAYLIYLLNWRP